MFSSGTSNNNSANNKSVNDQDTNKESSSSKPSKGSNSQRASKSKDLERNQSNNQSQQNLKMSASNDNQTNNTNFHMAVYSQQSQEAMENLYKENFPSLLKLDSKDKQQQILSKKLILCTYTFDMSPNNKQFNNEKEIKRQTLVELVDFVSGEQGIYSEEVVQGFITMIKQNLFRALPPSRFLNQNSFDAEEEETLCYEPGWQHLSCVYELLLRLVVSSEIDIRMLRRYIDIEFISNLLELFDSEDPRERDILKTILHRIYGKFMQHRAYIRKAINHVFYRFVFETERHNGIGELLEILGSIINGFAVPVKEEHKQTLQRALIPLHKPKQIRLYHQQLCYCISQYIEKEQALTCNIVNALMKFWPNTNSLKELLFINELEDMLEIVHQPVFEQIQQPVFKQLAKCITSTHFQVSERALILLNNDKILPRIMANRDVLFPILVPALLANQKHWNGQVSENTKKLEDTFHDQDVDFYKQCEEDFKNNTKKETEILKQRSQKWEQVEQEASKNSFKQSSGSNLDDNYQENVVSTNTSEDELGHLHSFKDKQNDRQKQICNQDEGQAYNDVAMQDNDVSMQDSDVSSQTIENNIHSVNNQQITA